LAKNSSSRLDPDGVRLDDFQRAALLVLPLDAAVGGADVYKKPWHGHATTEDEMGQVRLANAGEDVCFVVTLYQPGTFMGGALLDKENLALAVSLVPEASASEPALVEVIEHPDPTDDYLYESRLNCTAANATALLATGFLFQDDAARKIEQYRIPDATVAQVSEEIRRLHREYSERFMRWVRKPAGTERPVPPWQKKP
jgi:hypothetical protein